MRLPVEDISVVLKRVPELPFDHSSFHHISTQEVCHMAFWYVTVVKPENLPSKLSPLTTWCTDILSIDHRSSFQSSWCGPLSGSVYWGEPPRMMQPQPPGHQAVSFRLGHPEKNLTFHWHPQHSQPIDTRARWGRTSAEYNSLFCMPFSKLLIPGWISKNLQISILLWPCKLNIFKKDDVYILPRKLIWNLKIPLGKGETSTKPAIIGFHVRFRGCKYYVELFSIDMHPNSLETLQGTYGYGAGLCPWPSSEP